MDIHHPKWRETICTMLMVFGIAPISWLSQLAANWLVMESGQEGDMFTLQMLRVSVTPWSRRPTMQELGDEALLQAVALTGDPEAFQVLTERLQKPAYSLALRVTGQREMAEEAVEEALLKVWLSAPTYQPMGKAREWIMRIVVHESLKALRLANRFKRDQERAEMRAPAQPEMGLIEGSEQEEFASACSRFLDQLPFKDRQLIALHYCGGLSLGEIAQELETPERTVAYRIQKTLEELRALAVSAGFGAITLGVAENALQLATSALHSVPPGLQERILAKIAALERERPRTKSKRSQGPAALWSSSYGLAGAAALALAAGGVLWWMGAAKEGASGIAKPGSASQTPAQGQPAERPFSRTWDFNTPEPAHGISVEQGRWHWVDRGGPDGSGCMESETELLVAHFEFPVKKLPILITWRQNSVPQDPEKGYASACGWLNFTPDVRLHFGKKTPVREREAGVWDAHQTLLTEDTMQTWSNGRRVDLIFGRRGERAILELRVRQIQRLDDLKIQELGLDKVTAIQEYRDAVARIEPSRRVGVVALPELKSEQPGEPVFAEFMPSSRGIEEE